MASNPLASHPDQIAFMSRANAGLHLRRMERFHVISLQRGNDRISIVAVIVVISELGAGWLAGRHHSAAKRQDHLEIHLGGTHDIILRLR
jgi:hypothetical protein